MTEPDPHEDDATDPSQGVYGISVASGMVGTGVQNLRAYERAGLLNPDRTAGGTRLYSPDDVARLRRIQRLLTDGLNLTGIGRVLDLEDDLAEARSELEQLGAVTRPPTPAPSGPAPEPSVEDAPAGRGRAAPTQR
jgi:MerR family transcriptional regulator/heat shock protein HspR